jgi:hypothetical protein
VAYELDLPPSSHIHPVTHISLILPYHDNDLQGHFKLLPAREDEQPPGTNHHLDKTVLTQAKEPQGTTNSDRSTSAKGEVINKTDSTSPLYKLKSYTSLSLSSSQPSDGIVTPHLKESELFTPHNVQKSQLDSTLPKTQSHAPIPPTTQPITTQMDPRATHPLATYPRTTLTPS